jgi:hypothetical protein
MLNKLIDEEIESDTLFEEYKKERDDIKLEYEEI